MNLPYVCASCRRRLQRQAVPQQTQWLHRLFHSGLQRNATQSTRRGHQGYGSHHYKRSRSVSADGHVEEPAENKFEARLYPPLQDGAESKRIYSNARRIHDDAQFREIGYEQGGSSRNSPLGGRSIESHKGPSPSTSSWGAMQRVRAATPTPVAVAAAATIHQATEQQQSEAAAIYKPNSRIIQAWHKGSMPDRRTPPSPTSQTLGNASQANKLIDKELADLSLPFQHIGKPALSISAEPSAPTGPTLLPAHPLDQLLRLNVSRHLHDIPIFRYEDETGLQGACNLLVERLVPAWCNGSAVAADIPKPTLLHARMVGMNLKAAGGVDIWSTFTWGLLRELSKRSTLDNASSSQDHDKAILMELLTMWDRFLVRHRYGHMPRTTTPTWPALSRSKRMNEIKEWFSKDFATRWGHIFPRFRAGGTDSTDTAALLSLAIVQRCQELGLTTRRAKGFQVCISRLMVNSTLANDLDKHKAVMMGKLGDSNLVSALSPQLQWVFSNAVTIFEESQTPVKAIEGPASAAAQSKTGVNDIVDSFKKRVSRAIADGNPGRVDSLLAEAQSSFSRATADEARLPAALWAHFIFGFAALKRPHRALEVLSSMVQHGITPNLSTWDSMIRGSGLARDYAAVHDIWGRMIESGVRADAQIWATRIHALVVSGHWQSAMAAFQEMTSQWISAARAGDVSGQVWELSDTNEAPKPTARCLNSLVAGLARGLKYEQLGEVLRWAKMLGIRPDAYTFNPLFKVAALRRDGALTESLLKQMQALGVAPDTATFTMMLDSIFQDEGQASDADSAEEQRQANVASLFRTMQAAGVSATAHTFATLVNGLLKSSRPNEAAAYSIVKYLAAKGLPLSSAIYTALITHHFESATPDLGAVERLWNEARAARSVSLDVVFYDRLIEGFAKADQVGKAMTALTQAGKRGKVPGWFALTEVVSALLRAGDSGRAQHLVLAVLEEEKTSRDNLRARIGQAKFWAVVREGGLEGAPVAEAAPLPY